MSAYQFKLQLPTSESAIQELITRTVKKVDEGTDQIKLSLEEGLALFYMTGLRGFNVTCKLAYPPGKKAPCYATGMVSMTVLGKTVFFPHDEGTQPKVNMWFDDSPEVHPITTEAEELYYTHSAFEESHKANRYKGSAREKVSMILDLFGHITGLDIAHNKTIMVGGEEFNHWLFNVAKISEQEFQRQIDAAFSTFSFPQHIAPYVYAEGPQCFQDSLEEIFFGKAAIHTGFSVAQDYEDLVAYSKDPEKASDMAQVIEDKVVQQTFINTKKKMYLYELLAQKKFSSSFDEFSSASAAYPVSETYIEQTMTKLGQFVNSQDMNLYRAYMMSRHMGALIDTVICMFVNPQCFSVFKNRLPQFKNFLEVKLPSSSYEVVCRYIPADPEKKAG